MAKKQKFHTPEFKQQIVDRYNARGTSYPQLEPEYVVNRSTINSWVKQLSPLKVSDGETVPSRSIRHFRENQRLKIENEILKSDRPFRVYSKKNNKRDCDFYSGQSDQLFGISDL